MKTVFVCALLLGLSLGQLQQQQQEYVDDGSYHPELYEVPYHGETSNQLSGGYRQEPAQRQQQEVYRPPPPQAYEVPSSRVETGSYQSDPRQAAILAEQRYLSNDGKFGASYSQEDGVEFKEEAEPDGTRRGQYSWIDPSGQRRTVTYTAGKHGFSASGDHLPSGAAGSLPQPAAQPQYVESQPQYVESQPRYVESQPRYVQPQQYQQPAPAPRPVVQSQYQPAPRVQYSPRQEYQVAEPVQYQPAPQPQARLRPAPQYSGGPAHPDVASQSSGGYTISSSY